jgi:hypothetical protein
LLVSINEVSEKYHFSTEILEDWIQNYIPCNTDSNDAIDELGRENLLEFINLPISSHSGPEQTVNIIIPCNEETINLH